MLPTSLAPDPGSLDLHEGISDPAALGCRRWPEHLRLLNRSTGELVRGRCRATNLCDYCAKLAAVENAELLALDASEYAPTLWVVLTTRSGSVDPKRFYRSREAVWKAVRRRWPDAEYAFLVEFTTGYGPRSGGQRRPHWNLLVKGVPVEDVDELRQVVVERWCAREDAEPWAQHVGAIAEAGGLLRYLALHFQKESQAPPKGWRGHRFRTSAGYLVRPASELRVEAKRALRVKRRIWRGEDAETAALEVAAAELDDWQLQHVVPWSFRPVARQRSGLGRRERPERSAPARDARAVLAEAVGQAGGIRASGAPAPPPPPQKRSLAPPG